MLELLNGNSINLYHQSYLLFIMARTYYDISKKYLMPRLSGLSPMLIAGTDNERRVLLNKFRNDTAEVQTKVIELLNERKQNYKKVISKKHAEFNEHIDDQTADGNEDDIIAKGKSLLSFT